MSKDYLKKDFWKNIHFERLVVWYGVNWKIIHFFRSIHSAKCAFFYSSISSNHPGAKSVVRRAFNSVLQTAATTLSFYSVFFFFGHTDRKIIWIFPYKPSPSRMEQTHMSGWKSTVASAASATGSVLCEDSDYILVQCTFDGEHGSPCTFNHWVWRC